jgi:Prismane/CO dehydrogenase family
MLSRILGHSARKTAARLCFSGSSSSRNRIGAIAWASTTTTERCLALNTTTAVATTTTTTTTGSSVRVMSTAATAAAQQSPPPPPPVAMFCRQCEQTQNHTACVTVGVCGKTSETAAVQDALMRAVQSLSAWTVAARNAGLSTDSLQTANELILQGAFSTMTNVNFSEARICNYIQQLETVKAQLQTQLQGTQHEPTERVAHNVNLRGLDFGALEEYGYTVSVPVRQQRMANDDAFALQELATYALKGVSAYASHCQQLGYMDDDIMNDIQRFGSNCREMTTTTTLTPQMWMDYWPLCCTWVKLMRASWHNWIKRIVNKWVNQRRHNIVHPR